MKSTCHFLSIMVVFFAATTANAQKQGNRVFAKIEDDPDLPRVLLIGDSISIGYTLGVRERLEGIANVHRPPTNCGPTTRGLAGIDSWLGDGQWDVIHFNWGLHDLKYVDRRSEPSATSKRVDPSQGVIQVPIEEYSENLDKLIQRMQKTGATLIWRTTTPVPAEGSHGRISGDAARYNEAAKEIVKKYDGILVDDLYALVKPSQDKWKSSKGNVHFNKQGNEALAEHVADTIRKAIEN